MNKEREVDKITIHYDDGTEKTVEKGIVLNIKEENGERVCVFTMCHIQGRERALAIEGCLHLRGARCARSVIGSMRGCRRCRELITKH